MDADELDREDRAVHALSKRGLHVTKVDDEYEVSNGYYSETQGYNLDLETLEKWAADYEDGAA